MPYLLLMSEPGEQRRNRNLEDGTQAYDRMLAFTADLKARGLVMASDSLKSDIGGIRVEVRDGKRNLIDGPFSEAKEIIGGFFLIDCATREQAVAIASGCPAAEWGTVEVRETGPCYGN